MTNVVSRAIEVSGGLSAFATQVGVKPPSAFKWRATGRIPAERVLTVERITGIPRHELRPDLYPRPTRPEAA